MYMCMTMDEIASRVRVAIALPHARYMAEATDESCQGSVDVL
jgi:hypothetical protein